MKNDEKIIPNEALDNIMAGVSIDLEAPEAIEEADAYLATRKLDVGSFLGRVAETVEAGYKTERLSWMETAKKRVAEGATQASSWLNKSREEIEQRVAEVLSGALGPKPLAAFRNFEEMSLEDKASLLDDLELMNQDDDETDSNQN